MVERIIDSVLTALLGLFSAWIFGKTFPDAPAWACGLVFCMVVLKSDTVEFLERKIKEKDNG